MEFYKKNKGIINAVLITAVIVFVVAWFSKGSTAAPNANTQGNDVIKPSPSETFPLKFGSRGDKVGIVQTYLQKISNNKALPQFGIDNIWGAETAAAVSKYLNVSQINEELFKTLV